MSNNNSVDDESDMNIDERTMLASIPQSLCKESLLNQNSYNDRTSYPSKLTVLSPEDSLLGKERPVFSVHFGIEEDQIPLERLSPSNTPVKSFKTSKYKNPLIKKLPSRKKGLNSESSRSDQSSLYLRLQEYKVRSELKVINAASQAMQKKLEECTFKPKINNNTPTRSFEHFLQLQQTHLDKLNAKVKNQGERPRPKLTLCQNSYKILNKRKSLDKCKDRETSLEKTKKSASAESSPMPSPTHKYNNKILKEKLVSEFNKVYEELSSSEGLRYSLYIILLKRMNFVRSEPDKMLALDSWELLSSGSEYASKQTILSFLLSVMNITHSRKIHLKYIAFYQNRSLKTQPPPTVSTKSRCHSKERIEYLATQRQNSLQKWTRMKIAKEKEEIDNCTFKPKINDVRTREKKKESIETMWKGLRKGRRSTQKAISLFSLSAAIKANAKQRIEDARDFELHDDMRQCTFSPNLRKHHLLGKSPKTQAKGVSEAVNRIRNARNESSNSPGNKAFNCGIERKSKRVNDFKHLAAVNSPKCSFKVSNVFYSDSDSESCVQEISVVLPDGTVDKIYISNDDEKSSAVDCFIKKHSLQPDVSEQLRQEIMNN